MPRRSKAPKDKEVIPYHKFPFLLKGRAEIAKFMRISPNMVPVWMKAGAPIRFEGGVFLADKLALRQYFGVQIMGQKGGKAS